MSLLRNNTDNTINFQRASCTLDGCVKIWTSRVDSVGTETGKLLSNLASDVAGGDDGDDDGEEGEGGEGGGKKKKKSNAPSSTLAKNPAQLRSKKLELDFSVDPLFKKTSADFDEGGAGGLLMNHLGLAVTPDGGLRVVFDAGDSGAAGGEDEAEMELEDEPEDEVDLSVLRGELQIPPFSSTTKLNVAVEEYIPDLSVLPDLAISHSLGSFSFASSSSTDPNFFDPAPLYQDSFHDDGSDDEMPADNFAPMDVDGDAKGAGEVEDFFTGDQAVADDYYSGDFPPAGPSHDAEDEYGEADGGMYGSTSTTQPFNPGHRPTERELIMAMAGDGDDGSALDYFDRNFLKNWAGPEHWKLRRAVGKRRKSI